MRAKSIAAIVLALLAACAGLAACVGAGAGGGELVVVESHQFT